MSKKARSEGNRVACLIKSAKSEFYTTDVDINENSNDMLVAMENVKKTLGKMKSAFMLISGGDNLLVVVAYVPEELNKITSQNWVNNSIVGLERDDKQDVIKIGDNYTLIEIKVGFPFKIKDIVRSNSIAFLTKSGCMNDEESSEEFIGFDDI